MNALKAPVFCLVAGMVLAMSAAPMLAQTSESEVIPGQERLGALLAGFDLNRAPAVLMQLEDGTTERARMCGTPDPTPEYLEGSRRALAAVADVRRELSTQANLTARIPIFFHVIQRPSGQGFLSDAAIAEQVEVLNQRYRKLGVEFYLQGVEDVVHNGWFKKCLPFKRNENLNRKFFKMVQRLAEDPASTINIYTCRPHSNTLGVAFLPGVLPEDSPINAIILDYRSLPGGPYVSYSEGGTAVHEMGHYLGLLHTFHPGTEDDPTGCDGEGDEVADTAFEAEPAFECEPRDSCPQPGMDPITNFMDYTDDLCKTKFTRGQRRRMVDMTLLYRPTLVGVR